MNTKISMFNAYPYDHNSIQRMVGNKDDSAGLTKSIMKFFSQCLNGNFTGFNSLYINENTLEIYPNPSSDLVYIRTINQKLSGKIEIINARGEIVYSNNFTDSEDKIYIGNLVSGLYWVRIVSERGGVELGGKLIKEDR